MGVLDREAVTIIVEVCPDAFGAALLNALCPCSNFLRRVVVPVPLGFAMESNVNITGCCNQFIWEIGGAARAEDDP